MIEIVDTHQHLWDLSRHKHSWCDGISPLNRSFVMSDYLAATKDASVVASVHVEADPDEPDMANETRWLLSLAAEKNNPLSGLVIKALPEREDFARYLEQFAGELAVKGVRRVLHTQPDEMSQSESFRANVRSLSQLSLTFDLCVLARQLPIATDLARACPDVSFVLDHCGIPNVKDKGLDPWRGDLLNISRLPNVVACKISGIVAYANPAGWQVDDLRPFFDHAVECFGHNRVVFGSDWPVCNLTASFARWIAAATEITAGWSASDRSSLFVDNARRVYRL